MTIPVYMGGDDVGALDTLCASRQGLLLILLDGRVILLPLSWDDAKTTEAAWAAGKITDLTVGGPYTLFHRTRIH